MRLYALCLIFISAQGWADCIPGTTVIKQTHPNKPAIAQDSIIFDVGMREIPLKKVPDFKDTRIFIIAENDIYPLGQAAALPDDWCYDTEKNKVRFTAERPRMRHWGEIVGLMEPGSRVWVGYFSSSDFNPECIPGQFLEHGKPDTDGYLNGQQWQYYKPGMENIELIKKPKEGHGIAVRVMTGNSVLNAYGLDWCYSRADNKVHFLRVPFRVYDLGHLPGGAVDKSDAIWLAYVPEKPNRANAQ